MELVLATIIPALYLTIEHHRAGAGGMMGNLEMESLAILLYQLPYKIIRY
jgi:hypothetical protein